MLIIHTCKDSHDWEFNVSQTNLCFEICCSNFQKYSITEVKLLIASHVLQMPEENFSWKINGRYLSQTFSRPLLPMLTYYCPLSRHYMGILHQSNNMSSYNLLQHHFTKRNLDATLTSQLKWSSTCFLPFDMPSIFTPKAFPSQIMSTLPKL